MIEWQFANFYPIFPNSELIVAIRERGPEWLLANFKENYAPKKKITEVTNTDPKKRMLALDSFFADDEDVEFEA